MIMNNNNNINNNINKTINNNNNGFSLITQDIFTYKNTC